MRDSLGPLGRHRDFVHLWAAQSVSAFGSRITRTALPVIAILLVTADPVQIAILSALSVIPGVLVGLFAGGFIDRHAKRPVMVWSDVVRALLVLSIPIAAWSAHLGIVQLYVVAALVGGFSALFRLADNAYLPVLIGRDHLVEGNSKLQATDSVAEIGGPGLAGVLIQWLTAPVTMVIDAFVVRRVRDIARAHSRGGGDRRGLARQRPSLLEDLRIGARAGFGHPIVGPTFWSFAIDDFANGFFMALYMLYAIADAFDRRRDDGHRHQPRRAGRAGGCVRRVDRIARLGLGRAMIVTLADRQDREHVRRVCVARAAVRGRVAVGQPAVRRRRDGGVPDSREQLSAGGAAARRDGARQRSARGDDRRAVAARRRDRRAAGESDVGDVRRLGRLRARTVCGVAAVAAADRFVDRAGDHRLTRVT